jgi:hypothetical protein
MCVCVCVQLVRAVRELTCELLLSQLLLCFAVAAVLRDQSSRWRLKE